MAAPAQAETLSLQNTFDFSSGHYGDPILTDEIYEAVAVKYETGNSLIKLTIPYLYVHGPANFIPDFGSVPNSSKSTQEATRSGPGDIVASIDQTIPIAALPNSDFDVIGKVKFATASYARGLGTGENDYYLQLEWTQHFAHGISTILDFGRRFVESPAETHLHDVWYGSAGASWEMNPRITFSSYMDLRQSASLHSGGQIEATVEISDKFAPGWKASVYGTKGFAAGSANLDGGLIIERSFAL